MRILGFFLLLCCFVVPASAQNTSVQDALEYADDGKWPEARRLAGQSDKPELISLIEWRFMLDTSSGAGFGEIIRFMQQYPNWPYQSTLQHRAEQALRDGGYSDNLLLSYFSDTDPLTGIGKITLVGALQRAHSSDVDRIKRLIHEGWIQGDFDSAMESYILKNYGSMLNSEDHLARTDRLLWDKQTNAAERMLKIIPSSHRALYEARIALIQNSRNSDALLKKIPADQKSDQGLTFDRIRYRARRNDNDGVSELLRTVPESDKYPEKWWPWRHKEAREAIKQQHYKNATELVRDYDRLESGDLADALWLKGWLLLEYNGNPQDALELFARMYDAVSYPVSLARAAYWAGRSAHRTGSRKKADEWYRKAAAHPTTFYGQLAAIALNTFLPDLPADEPPSDHEPQNLFERAIKLCIENGEYDIARQMITHGIAEAQNEDEVVRLASMGYHAGIPHLSVNASKRALQKQVILTRISYPRPEISADIAIERPLMLAISRQESEFDREAKSPAGALGTMQLLPSTARYIARKHDIIYSHSRLSDTEYNIILGSHYLARMINAYDGSYILGIAAYNAGPGNVNKWIRLFGRPGNSLDDAVNWIEHIPFSETRNYVQRVLENLQVYRRLESPDTYNVKMLEEDLLR